MPEPASAAQSKKKGKVKDQSETPVKPASQEADWRSAAAMVALRELAPAGFENASGLWAGCLLQKGLVFQESAQTLETVGEGRRYYLSLSFQSFAAILWQIEEVQPGLFKLADGASTGGASERIRYACCTDLARSGEREPFQGVPVELCSWAMDSQQSIL